MSLPAVSDELDLCRKYRHKVDMAPSWAPSWTTPRREMAEVIETARARVFLVDQDNGTKAKRFSRHSGQEVWIAGTFSFADQPYERVLISIPVGDVERSPRGDEIIPTIQAGVDALNAALEKAEELASAKKPRSKSRRFYDRLRKWRAA